MSFDVFHAADRMRDQMAVAEEKVVVDARDLRAVLNASVYAVPEYGDDEVTVISWLWQVLANREVTERGRILRYVSERHAADMDELVNR